MTNLKQRSCSFNPAALAKMSLSTTEPRVYTSYFGNSAKLKKGDVVMVCIAQFAPRFIKGVIPFKRLAPTAKMLSGIKGGTMSPEEFDEDYADILAGCHAQEIYDELLALGEGKSVAIMCYEKPPDTCHRHAVQKWLSDAGIDVKEFPF